MRRSGHDNDSMKGVRAQRDKMLRDTRHLWMYEDGVTFNKFDARVKRSIVVFMSRLPAGWPVAITLKRLETFITNFRRLRPIVKEAKCRVFENAALGDDNSMINIDDQGMALLGLRPPSAPSTGGKRKRQAKSSDGRKDPRGGTKKRDVVNVLSGDDSDDQAAKKHAATRKAAREHKDSGGTTSGSDMDDEEVEHTKPTAKRTTPGGPKDKCKDNEEQVHTSTHALWHRKECAS